MAYLMIGSATARMARVFMAATVLLRSFSVGFGKCFARAEARLSTGRALLCRSLGGRSRRSIPDEGKRGSEDALENALLRECSG